MGQTVDRGDSAAAHRRRADRIRLPRRKLRNAGHPGGSPRRRGRANRTWVEVVLRQVAGAAHPTPVLAVGLAGQGVERFGGLQTHDLFGVAFEKLRSAWV